jgi:hypothetical protein
MTERGEQNAAFMVLTACLNTQQHVEFQLEEQKRLAGLNGPLIMGGAAPMQQTMGSPVYDAQPKYLAPTAPPSAQYHAYPQHHPQSGYQPLEYQQAPQPNSTAQGGPSAPPEQYQSTHPTYTTR